LSRTRRGLQGSVRGGRPKIIGNGSQRLRDGVSGAIAKEKAESNIRNSINNTTRFNNFIGA